MVRYRSAPGCRAAFDHLDVVDVLDRAEADVLPGGQVVAGDVLEDHRDAGRRSELIYDAEDLRQVIRSAAG